MILLSTASLAGLLLLGQATAEVREDARVQLIRLQQAGDLEGALSAIKKLRAVDPESAGGYGLDYLEGHLLDRLGRRREAASAFASTVTSSPDLEAFARLRLALDQEALGHPEVAAGVAATVLGSNPPRSLVRPATDLLVRSLAAGGDCRLLKTLVTRSFEAVSARQLQLAQADCLQQGGELKEAVALLVEIVRGDIRDLPGREAALRLAALEATPDAELTKHLGRTFHHHREFERAVTYLARIVEGFPESLSRENYKLYYEYARSYFWLGRYDTSARLFGDLANRATIQSSRAQAFYQQGRSHELVGKWSAAIGSYGRCFDNDATGSYSGASLIGAMRLHWRRGEEDRALEILEQLRSRRQWRFEYSRATLFVASSDIVRGRSDRASAWLDQAHEASRSSELEVDYWRGRLAELLGQPEEAVASYATLLRREPFHPLAFAARARLAQDALLASGSRLALVRSSESSTSSLVEAIVLFDQFEPDHPARSVSLDKVADALRKDNRAREFLDMSIVPTDQWRLWSAYLRSPEEQLLALGVWEEGARVARRHFPVAEPDLALTAARLMIQSGEVRRGLLLSEVLHQSKPASLPEWMLPASYRRQLYPFSFSLPIQREAKKRNVDPFLLASIIRQESRFDPKAVSPVAARGLTQFVYATAQRMSREIGLGEIAPADLLEPEIAIQLGSAYVSELMQRYGGRSHQAVAAYNAGEPQAELWQSYCYTVGADEYYTKVSFRETRDYVRKVLTGYAQYRDIWTAPSALAITDATSARTTGVE